MLSDMTFERREFLRRGAGLALASFVLPAALSRYANQAQAAYRRQDNLGTDELRKGSAKSCILVYLLGGPPHLDMFDLKPNAPAEIRGPFRPIATRLPGFHVCEHLPRLANIAQKLAVIRSVSHPNSNHTPMIYYT